MCSVRVTLSTQSRTAVARRLKTAPQQGHLRQVTDLLAILAVGEGRSFGAVAMVLRVHENTVAAWGQRFCCKGLKGAPRKKPTGRPPTLPPTQKASLATLIDAGPLQAGFSGACWRSPMIPPLLYERCGVFYNVFDMAQLLKNLGFSDQQAACVSAPLDDGNRHGWRTTLWPQILRLAKAREALRRLSDEASGPPWGTLTDTWARRGPQPTVKTSGTRKGDQVFGLIDDFTGGFFDQGPEGRFTSEPSRAFLTRVLAQVTPPLLLIQDGAQYHTSVAMQHFFAQHAERWMVCQLPSDSPDDHPLEKLWKKMQKAGTHVQYFPTVEALTDTVERALLQCANRPEEMLSWCSLPTEWAQAAYVRLARKSFS